MLLRLLFPSWAFFDAITDVPRLDVRCGGGDAGVGEWVPALEAPVRSGWQVLFHPHGTAHLALQALVDRLAVEEESGQSDDVTHGLVEALATRCIRERWNPSADVGLVWQWRIVAVDLLRPQSVRVIRESERREWSA